jgi:hypothetical protein
MQCYPQSCPSDVIDAARSWVDAIDEEARRPSA